MREALLPPMGQGTRARARQYIAVRNTWRLVSRSFDAIGAYGAPSHISSSFAFSSIFRRRAEFRLLHAVEPVLLAAVLLGAKQSGITMTDRAQQIYKPEFRFGLGGVSLGNEFDKHSDKDAEATLEAAWAVGVRYFDVAPWYGFGLSERRFGHFLHNPRRDDYLLSSKVGKLFKAAKHNRHAEYYPLSDSPNDIVFDYTADGVHRSIEDSLQRVGVDSLDVAFVHDISPDLRSSRTGGRSSTGSPRRARFRHFRKCETKASSGLGALV
jgi:hypothetical protein